MRKFLSLLAVVSLLSSIALEAAMARAGGRSSFSGGRSSTSYSNQGSRGSRTFDGGGAAGRKYAPMERTTTQNQKNSANPNNQNPNSSNPNNAMPNQPNAAGNFFQRHPFLTTFGAALAGSWLGHALFGSSGFGAAGAGAGGGIINIIMMVLGAIAVVYLVKFLTRGNRQSCATNNHFHHGFNQNKYNSAQAFSKAEAVEISVSSDDKNKFQYLLRDIQNAWSHQDMVTLKRLCTPEMYKYFSDSLAQNASQGIANKVEDVDVTMLEVSESWREGEMEYATAVIEWSSYDYMINLGKNPQDHDYIVEGGDKSLVMNTEAWTFARYGAGGNWILSAIAQVE